MKNLSNAIVDMALGRDGYVGMSAMQERNAIAHITTRAVGIAEVVAVTVEEDEYGTYNASVTFKSVANDEEVAHRLCAALNHRGNRLTEWLPDSDDLVVYVSGIRRDKLGI